MLNQTFKFEKGQWLLVSHDATGLEAVPLPVKTEDANERVSSFWIQNIRSKEYDMTTNDRFLDIVDKCLDLNLRNPDNEAQLKAIIQKNDCILQIVAGPGSGKTTVLVLRALRFVFVEGVLPENIVITTFTRKAARELRTRWLDWGTILCAELESDPDINLNQIGPEPM